MLIDFHTHIFPPAIRDRRDRFFHNEPAFELLYASPKAKLVGAAELVAQMDAQGVDKAVTFGFPWCAADTFKRHNDYIMEATARYPDRLIGFCCMDAAQAQAPAEVERCLSAGMAGVGELAFYCSEMACTDSGALDEIMALARRFDCPVMIHTNEPVGHAYPGKTDNTLAQIYALVKKYCDNRLVLAHWGGGLFWYTLMKKEVTQALTNVWFDTAASPFLYRSDIYRLAIELAGPDKILLGTDYPLLSVNRYLDDIEKSGVGPEDKQKICGRNAATLLKLNAG
ncbi:MAG: amidohydrolase [Desulfatitalea sp. BRH_c12]|nr:MAG: amidohydrolase [Desulfatitalea sp. BRH_c12]